MRKLIWNFYADLKVYRANPGKRIVCGPPGLDRNALAAEFQRAEKLAGVPPGSIVRPRE